MLFAKVDGVVKQATPGASGVCLTCEANVYAKCGKIRPWHWSHRANDCDPWSEPESLWHLWWKSQFPQSYQEVTIDKDGIRHRADIMLPGAKVLELQASRLSIEQVQARERFYGNMAWLYEATAWTDRLSWGKYGFLWKRPSLTQAAITKPLFWDVGTEIWKVKLGRAKVQAVSLGNGRYCEVRFYRGQHDIHGRPVLDAKIQLIDAHPARVLGKVERKWLKDEFIKAFLK